MKDKFLQFLWFICILTKGYSQDNFSENILYATKNIHLYIPALSCTQEKMQANFLYKSYEGRLSVMRTEYADFNYRLGKPCSDSCTKIKQVVGAGLYNDREGDYFNKSRYLMRYAVQVPIDDQWKVSGGVSFHIINYYFRASSAGVSGSDFSPSTNLSLGLYRSGFKIGASINDLNNLVVKPINYRFYISKYGCFFIGKDWALRNITLNGATRYTIYHRSQSALLVQGGAKFSRGVALYAMANLHKAWGGVFEISQIKLTDEHLVDLAFLYMIPTNKRLGNSSQFEINLRYYLSR